MAELEGSENSTSPTTQPILSDRFQPGMKTGLEQLPKEKVVVKKDAEGRDIQETLSLKDNETLIQEYEPEDSDLDSQYTDEEVTEDEEIIAVLPREEITATPDEAKDSTYSPKDPGWQPDSEDSDEDEEEGAEDKGVGIRDQMNLKATARKLGKEMMQMPKIEGVPKNFNQEFNSLKKNAQVTGQKTLPAVNLGALPPQQRYIPSGGVEEEEKDHDGEVVNISQKKVKFAPQASLEGDLVDGGGIPKLSFSHADTQQQIQLQQPNFSSPPPPPSSFVASSLPKLDATHFTPMPQRGGPVTSTPTMTDTQRLSRLEGQMEQLIQTLQQQQLSQQHSQQPLHSYQPSQQPLHSYQPSQQPLQLQQQPSQQPLQQLSQSMVPPQWPVAQTFAPSHFFPTPFATPRIMSVTYHYLC